MVLSDLWKNLRCGKRMGKHPRKMIDWNKMGKLHESNFWFTIEAISYQKSQNWPWFIIIVYIHAIHVYIYICNAWNVSSSTCKLYVVIRIHGPASGSREKSGPRIHFFSWTKKSGQVVQISWDLAGSWKDTHVFWCFFGREQLKPISGTMVDHADQLFHILNCFVFK